MRKGSVVSSILLSSTLALSLTGCMEKTGDVGNKNIRTNNVKRYDVSNRYYQNESNRMYLADDQANEMNRVSGRGLGNNNVVGMHANSNLELSDAVANKVATIPGIDKAYVMITNRNAYVGVTQKAHGKGAVMDQALKDKIADHVRTVSPTTDNVYVSANPDFMGRMENYAAEVRQGHPIQGFITEFNALVERIFPANSK
ncbi:YhcN/YlaJ family sporulation lipoprotein [Cohnella faecalis]|uniref:YhcN/YlaJ family sporulation lipoprotein n=1 Tax=Cohnella faecalis TaxID=2315694 RepID=UPI00131412A4|nr:YhcN/YlaJ family sporulation lipoprotein [Cohnella faecalis]